MNQHLGYVQSLNIRWVDGSISVKLDWNSTHFGTKKHLKQTQLSPLYPHCYIPINYVLIKGIPIKYIKFPIISNYRLLIPIISLIYKETIGNLYISVDQL